MQNKFEEYEKKLELYEAEFYRFFGEDADDYQLFWRLHRFEKEKYESIVMKHPTTKSTLSRIIQRVEKFLEDPMKAIYFKCLTMEDFKLPLLKPNNIINAKFQTTIEVQKFLQIAMYLHQYDLNRTIPRTILLEINAKYRRIPERGILLNQLQNQKMFIKVKEIFREVQVFSAEFGCVAESCSFSDILS